MSNSQKNHAFHTLPVWKYQKGRGGRESAHGNIVQSIAARVTENERILILGCYSGENDLLPLVFALEQRKLSVHIVAIDDVVEAIKQAQRVLVDSNKFEIVKQEGNQTYLRAKQGESKITVCLICEDLETYPKECFGTEDKREQYDKVIAFFVLHHLTNWLLCLDAINKCINENGELYLTGLADPVINAIENGSGNGDAEYQCTEDIYRAVRVIRNFHEKRKSQYGVLYYGPALGTDTRGFQNILQKVFNREDIQHGYRGVITREVLVEKLGLKPPHDEIQHNPIFWGQEVSNIDSEHCCISNDYADFLKSFLAEERVELHQLEEKEVGYNSRLILERFQKRSAHNKSANHDTIADWDNNYRSILAQLDPLLTCAKEVGKQQRDDMQDRAMLQLALATQAFTRETVLVTSLFWPLNRRANEIGVDTSLSGKLSFNSLITTRDFKNCITKYYNHLNHFKNAPMSELLFEAARTHVNWIFAPSDDAFSCEVIDNGIMRFVVFRIPTRYCDSVQEFVPNQVCDAFRFSNFAFLPMSEILRKNESKDDQLLMNSEVANQEFDQRFSLIAKMFREGAIGAGKWHHVEDDRIDSVARDFAERLPRYSYLNQLGTCLYITNRLYQPRNDNQRTVSNGGFFLCERSLKIEDLKKGSTFLAKRYEYIRDIVELYSKRLVLPKMSDDLFREMMDGERHARRAAVNSVMSRNMSHNIGSHVLAKLLTKEQLDNISDSDDGNQCTTRQGLNKPSTKEEQMANFNAYLKARMDYLADLATSTPTLQTNKLFFKEVLHGFDKNRLLLNYISGIHAREDDTKVKTFSYEIQCWHNEDGEETELTVDNDLMVALPNDILGCHAFYVILENIIRNTAKHGRVKQTKVIFKIEISTCNHNPELYEVRISDNVPRVEKYKWEIQEKPEYAPDAKLVIMTVNEDKKSEIKDTFMLSRNEKLRWYDRYNKPIPGEISEIDLLVYKQNRHLNESVLDSKTGKLRHGAWGLIEMDVSAAYLRKIAPEEVDDVKYSIVPETDSCNGNQKEKEETTVNILKAVYVNQSLGYRFHLLKPKNFLIVGDFDLNLNEQQKKQLTNNGVLLLSRGDFKPDENIYPHEFLLYEAFSKAQVKQYETALPTRRVEITSNKDTITSLLSKEDLSDVNERLGRLVWPLWVGDVLENQDVKSVSCFYDTPGPNGFHFGVSSEDKHGLKAIFLDHGKGWKELIAEGLDGDQEVQTKERNFIYVEPLSSRGMSILPVPSKHVTANKISPYFNKVSDISKWKIVESVALRIGILDERIQNAAFELNYEDDGVKIPFSQIFQRTNIIIPPKEKVDLNRPDFRNKINAEDKSVNDAVIAWLESTIKEGVDALIIHLGILEKLLEGATEKGDIISDFIRKYIRSNNNQGPILAITSGRGRPHNLPSGERFINLSSLMDCLVEDRSKYKLTNLILSARALED